MPRDGFAGWCPEYGMAYDRMKSGDAKPVCGCDGDGRIGCRCSAGSEMDVIYLSCSYCHGNGWYPCPEHWKGGNLR